MPDLNRWEWGFISLAIIARSVRYFLCFPLWEDECFLGVNIFNCGFRELLQPPVYHQVTPFLFLWLEKATVILLGFNELALRLPAFIVSMASLVLFVHLARRLLSGNARIFAIALFAVSYPCIRYAAEVKQYGTDMFASLVLIVLVVEWLRRPGEAKSLVALILWCPLAICLSLPAIFTTVALSVLLAGVMIRHPESRRWEWWVAFNLVILAGAYISYYFSIGPQKQAEYGFMGDYWVDSFMPLTSVFAVLKWLVVAHTGNLFAHPVGEKNFGSILTTILLAVGIVYLFKRRRSKVAWLLLLPLVVHLTAAVLQKYPYGGHVKFSMYIAPMIYLVMGVGCAVLTGIRNNQQTAAQRARILTVILVLVGGIGVVSMARDIRYPYKATSDMRQRAIAEWLWHDGNFEDRILCIKDDLKLSFSDATWKDLSWSAMYLCNKYIYQPRKMVREPRPAFIPPPSRRYIRYVLYRDPRKNDFNQEAFDRWLGSMKQGHEYAGMDRISLPRYDKHDRYLITIDYLEIYKFVLPDNMDTTGDSKPKKASDGSQDSSEVQIQ